MPRVACLPACGHRRSILSFLLETLNLERVLCRTDRSLTRQRSLARGLHLRNGAAAQLRG